MDKPLHVRVAEALGDDLGPCNAYIQSKDLESGWECLSCGAEGEYGPPGPDCFKHDRAATHYDTNWSATGPLQVRYGIAIAPRAGRWVAYIPIDSDEEAGMTLDYFDDFAEGENGLIAICNLIIALKASGKLEAYSAAPSISA